MINLEPKLELASIIGRKRQELGNYRDFLKRQIASNLISNTVMVGALIPVVKEIEEDSSSKELYVLEALKDKSVVVLRTHDLEQQYDQVIRTMETRAMEEQ